MTRQTRRTFLTTVGVAAVAGCSSLADRSDAPGGDTTTDASTANGANGETSDGNAAATTVDVTVADSFENLQAWRAKEGSVSKAGDAYRGDACARIDGSKRSKEGTLVRTFPGPVDLRKTNFSLAVKSPTHDYFKVALQLVAPEAGDVVESKRTLLGPRDRWVRLNLGVTGVEGSPDRSRVSELRLVARPRNPDSKQPITLFADDLRTVQRPKQGAVMFTFDDSHYTQYRAYQWMEKHDFAGVAGVIPETLGERDRLTEDQLHEMADAGWDVAAHPNVGDQLLPELSHGEQARLLSKTRATLESMGFEDGARNLVVPKNALGPTTFDLARKRYERILSFGSSPNALPLTLKDTIVSRFDGEDLAATRRLVDYAEEYGQLVVPMFHGVGDGGEVTEKQFAKILQYVDSKDVRVVTASDVLYG